MPRHHSLMSAEQVENKILLIRGQRVMLDSDLAGLYGVTTKALNQQDKRNADRFPPDFMFQLTVVEKMEVVTICDHLWKLKFSPNPPFAFTEHGAIMLAAVLNSPRAVEMSLFVVRAFIRLRQLLATHADLARKLEALERKYDQRFVEVFDAIRRLMTPPEVKRRRIGFENSDSTQKPNGKK